MERPRKFPELPLVNRMRVAASLFLELLLSRDPENAVIHIDVDILFLDSWKLEGCDDSFAIIVCVEIQAAMRGWSRIFIREGIECIT
jgi:hypothetical protein